MEQQSATSKPLTTATSTQSSIRSFFQPRTPSYAAPPSQIPQTSARAAPSPPKLSITPKAPANPTIAHPSLPPQACISTIHENHIQPLRRINSLLLPINYPDSFYNRLLGPETQPIFSRIILWREGPSNGTAPAAALGDAETKVVGGIVCRIDAADEGADTRTIYIQSLALLSPYRSYGLASHALDDIIAHATSDASPVSRITSLYAHVWSRNDEALQWYAKRGFAKEEPALHGYYRRLQPDTAWIVRRPLRPSDHLRHSSKPTNSTTTTTTTMATAETPAAPLSRKPDSRTIPPPTSLRPNPTAGLRAPSYQSMRPATEWNDLPSDILVPSRSNTPSLRPSPNSSTPSLLEPPNAAPAADPTATNTTPAVNAGAGAGVGAGGGIGRSSSQTRSASANAGKKKRQYPAAAFGLPSS
ncbi:MAG: hypothetical protein M1818_008269 [Claussenomyces sp. TS43310]|nr:MAG: hypothetical protein M1818_008269 [Claussenomyces sp. TS43310]